MDCPLEDSVVRIHYKGYLCPDDYGAFDLFSSSSDLDGMVPFYDSRKEKEGEPLEFGTGEGRVGGISKMRIEYLNPNSASPSSCSCMHARLSLPYVP